ncbi:MAG: acyltransferase [Acidobacteria bacterium]|nr:acyltransferase [Acidobacteriota bacterium]
MSEAVEYDPSAVEAAPRADAAVRFRHIPSLDGMRAVAVLLVVFFHAIHILPGLQPYLNGGFLGVDVFFVLSGFLITSILLQEFDRTGSISFKNFYVRRFLRLMPAYWLHLAVLFLLGGVLFTAAESEILYANHNFLYAFAYLTNWQRALNGSGITGLLSHTWSLAIEEQFYLFWAGFLFLLLRRLKRAQIVVAVAGLIGLTAWFRAFRWNGTMSFDFLYNAFDARMDALLVGCLVSMLVSWRFLPKKMLASRGFDLAALAAVFVVVFILFNLSDSFYSPSLYLGGFTVFALAVGVVVMRLATRKGDPFSRFLETRPMVWIGKTSYGIYLWHSFAISFVHNFDLSPAVKMAAALAITFTITAASYYLLEIPFLRLKSRFQ